MMSAAHQQRAPAEPGCIDHRRRHYPGSPAKLCSQTSSDMDPQVLTVADVPYSWLLQLCSSVEASARLALFRCSRQLLDHTLAGSDSVQLCLQFGQDLPTAAASLARLVTCKDGADIKLVVKAPRPVQVSKCCILNGLDSSATQEQRTAACRNSQWLTELAFKAVATAGSEAPMHRIKHLELQDDVLGGVIPYMVSAVFPNLQQLTRPARFVDPSLHIPVTRSPMRTLSFTSALYPGVSACYKPTQQLQLQLQELSQLRELNINLSQERCGYIPGECDEEFWSDAASPWMDALDPLRPQLLHMSLPHSAWLQHMLTKPWPKVQVLDVSRQGAIGDGDMRLLLSELPSLQQLKVSAIQHLEHGYAGIPCTWKHFTIQKTASITGLSRLPLQHLESLFLGGVTILGDNGVKKQVTHFLDSVPARLRISKPPNSEVIEVRVDVRVVGIYAALGDELYALLPLLQLLQQPLQITLPVKSLKIAVDLLEQAPHVVAIRCVNPSWYLPNGKRINTYHFMTLLTQFCMQASRPVKLVVPARLAGNLALNWQQQLINAMDAAGHQHVCLMVSTEE